MVWNISNYQKEDMAANKIRVGIVGYGNLGKGAEKAIRQNKDFELVAVITRRDPEALSVDTPDILKVKVEDASSLKGKVDIMILCGGSATDLPVQGPQFAKDFNTVDSFDTHAKIPEYFSRVDQAAKEYETTSIISVGWDPGLFSMNRLLTEAILPEGSGCTFWGKGVSQGHSDAIRRIEGVINATQYTIPIEEAIEKARNGESDLLMTRDKHLRECFVVAAEGADQKVIKDSIINMPNYFSDYDTIVHFIDQAEFDAKHNTMPHGGFVVRRGITGDRSRQNIEFSLKLESNPEFTASVLIAFARAAYRLNQEGKTGAYTVLDIPLSYLSPKTGEALRKEIL